MGAPINPVWVSGHYAFENDDGTIDGSTFIAAEDTAITQATDAPFRLRINYGESAGQNAGDSISVDLQYSLNSATYTQVTTTSSVVQYVTSSNETDGSVSTTERLTTPPTGAATYVDSEFDDSDTTRVLTPVDEYYEVSFNIVIISADVTDTDTIEFRIVGNTDGSLVGVLDSYDTIPSLTAKVAASVEAALTTVSAAAAVGAVGLSIAIALTGVSSTSSVGTVTTSVSAAVAGVSSTSAVGAVGTAKSGSTALSGVGSTAGVGTLVASVPGAITYHILVGEQMITTLEDSKFPLGLAVDDSGGVTGLDVTAAIRDPNDNTSYLDFADGTFKTSGWTTKFKGLVEYGGGYYGTLLDVSVITNFPTANHAVIEYDISGSVTAIATGVITIAQTWADARALTVGKFLGLK